MRARTARGHLEGRVRLFTVAAAIGLVGIYLDERWLTNGAVVVLLGALVLGLRGRRTGPPSSDDVPDPGDAEG